MAKSNFWIAVPLTKSSRWFKVVLFVTWIPKVTSRLDDGHHGSAGAGQASGLGDDLQVLQERIRQPEGLGSRGSHVTSSNRRQTQRKYH